MPRKVWFAWELTGKGHYAPSLYFDAPPGEFAIKGLDPDFRPILHPIIDPELLAKVLNSDGGNFAPVIEKFPAPVRERDPIAVTIETVEG